MGAYIVQTGTFRIKVQAGKGVRKYENDYHIHLDELALYKSLATVKQASIAVLVKLVAKHESRQAEKLKLEIAEYPPHTIFCECKNCIPKQWIFKKKGK